MVDMLHEPYFDRKETQFRHGHSDALSELELSYLSANLTGITFHDSIVVFDKAAAICRNRNYARPRFAVSKPLTVLCVNGESDPAETGSFIEMHKRGVDITVITWPDTFNYDALMAAGVPTIPYVLKGKISRPCIRFIRDELQAKTLRCAAHARQASDDERNLGVLGHGRQAGRLSWHCRKSELPRSPVLALSVEPPHRSHNLRVRGHTPVSAESWHAGLAPGSRRARDDPQGTQPGLVSAALRRPRAIWHTEGCLCRGLHARGVPRKGVPVLLDAIDKLPPGLNIHFLLAGNEDG